MAPEPRIPFSFSSGFVESRGVGLVLAQLDEMNEQGVYISFVLQWLRETAKWSSHDLEWISIRVWAEQGPPVRRVVLGPWGDVFTVVGDANAEEQVDESTEGPVNRGELRDLRRIGAHLYAAGMGRQVYRRLGENRWERRDEGIVTPLGSTDVVGINSLDGLSEDDFLGVGFAGEIWRCRGGRWYPIDSPTNVILHRVRVVEPGLAFAGGQDGVLLRGRDDRWEVIQHEVTTDDVWGMEWFRGSLYVACDAGVFRLGPDDKLEPITLAPGRDVTTRHLHANDGVMWSFGPKDLYWTEDVATWHSATPRYQG